MLSIISTPIGNLGDISARAKKILSECDAVICEDTRVTGRLLKLLGISKKELMSFHSYSNRKKADVIIKRLQAGDHLAMVSDAGTPGISDPGYAIIARARGGGFDIEAAPGPSAFLAALSVSGLPINRFTYLGFLPLKKGRRKTLEAISNTKHTVVFYEAPHRIRQTLAELADVCADQPERAIVICRELTKMHEEVVSATIGDIANVVDSLKPKGEFCVVVGSGSKARRPGTRHVIGI